MTGRPVSEDDLQAHVDGVLAEDRRAAVERHLDEQPAAAARVGQYAADRSALRDILADIAEAPVPSRLQPHRFRAGRPGGQAPLWRSAVASLAALVIGLTVGWSARQAANPPLTGVAALGKEAVENYRVFAHDQLRPVELGPAESAALSGWMSDRLHRAVQPPDLTAAGYRLIGGRLAATEHGPAALFLYSQAGGERLEVFIRPMRTRQAAHMIEHTFGDSDGLMWADDGLGYGIIGTRSLDVLRPIASEVRNQARQRS